MYTCCGVTACDDNQPRITTQHRPQLLLVVGFLVVVDQRLCDIGPIWVGLLVYDDAVLELLGAEIDELPVALCGAGDSGHCPEEPCRELKTQWVHAFVEQFDSPMHLAFLEHAKIPAEGEIAHRVEGVEVE